MKSNQAWAALRSGWWLALIGLLVGGAVAFGITFLRTPLYTSSTEFFVSTTDSTSTAQALQGSQFSLDRATSYARLIAGEDLAERVIQRLKLTMSAGQLQGEISASAVPDTVLIDVSVTDPSPQQAQRIASAVGEEFTGMVTQLETPTAGGASPVKVTVTDRPGLPSSPSSPNRPRNVAVGLAVGLLAGAGLALARGGLDRSIKNGEQAADVVGAPVIGHVLRDNSLAKRHVIEGRGAGPATENYRQLRNNLQWLDGEDRPSVIMVTSALPSEGKTTVVINLALALAAAGRKVLIVDSDLRRPKVTEYLGMITGGAGLSSILAGSAGVDDVVQRYGDRDVWVIASGPTPPHPGELLASTDMQALIEKLRGDYDYVLLDAPPVLPVADASGLAVHVDGVLLSVRHGSTREDQLRAAAAELDHVRAKVLGVVLNIVARGSDVADAYGY